MKWKLGLYRGYIGITFNKKMLLAVDSSCTAMTAKAHAVTVV